PGANATVNGTVTLTATAGDNIGVAGVQFKLDGANVGAEGTGTSPSSLSWNTTGASNGSHTLTAVARDRANLTTTSATVPVTVNNAAATIAFRQVNYAVPQTPQSTVTVAYIGPQTAGNLNVVLVGWNDGTATVTSVTDSRGNAYAVAVPPTVMTGTASHDIYYAAHIAARAAGANTVTVRVKAEAPVPGFRILEVAGLDPLSPWVGGVGASGTSRTSNS